MAIGGRRPRPIRLKVLEGNPGKRRLPKNVPEPTTGLDTPPNWFGSEEREEFDRIHELVLLGVIARPDYGSAVAAASHFGKAMRADRVVRELGLTHTTPNGHVQQRPEVSTARSEWQAYRLFAAELGLTPSSRSRLEVAETPEGTTMERLIGRGGR